MRFFGGRITVSQLFRSVHKATNAGVVTVTGAETSIVAQAVGPLVAGDEVVVLAGFEGTKGALAGRVSAHLGQLAGTASIEWSDAANAPEYRRDGVPATEQIATTLVGHGHCTTGGTLSLGLQGVSDGSNLTVAAGNGWMSVFIFAAA